MFRSWMLCAKRRVLLGRQGIGCHSLGRRFAPRLQRSGAAMTRCRKSGRVRSSSSSLRCAQVWRVQVTITARSLCGEAGPVQSACIHGLLCGEC
jgi:hypothetical protein